jgi:hypothetical protein
MMHTVLLVIHVLSAIVWLGAGFAAALIGPRLVSQGGSVALSWMRVAESLGPRLFGTASGLTLLSGIGLVLTSNAYGFGSLFVIFGLVVWILLAIGNGAFGGPREKKALESFEAGDDEAGREILNEMNTFVVAEYALLVAVVVTMITRWGA